MSVNIETACDSIRFTVHFGKLFFSFIEIIEEVFVAYCQIEPIREQSVIAMVTILHTNYPKLRSKSNICRH